MWYPSSPGAREAVDEFFAEKAEVKMTMATGQCFVKKLPVTVRSRAIRPVSNGDNSELRELQNCFNQRFRFPDFASYLDMKAGGL